MKIVSKLLSKYLGNSKTSDEFVAELKRGGVTIGEETVFYAPNTCFVDRGKGKYIVIGRKCQITRGVVILAHDFSYSVLNDVYGVLPQNTAMTTIGDNVFIGMNAIILMGSNIGSNVIIGAGAVVSGNIENNSVYAGNPARKICTLDEFFQKRMDRFEQSAIIQAKRIYEVTGKLPTEFDMELYNQLFSTDRGLFEKMGKNSGIIPQKIPQKTKYDSLEDFLHKNHIGE